MKYNKAHPPKSRQYQRALTLALTIILFFLLWEAVGRSGLYSPHLFPPPTRVCSALAEMILSGELAADLKASSLRWGGGFLLGNILGIVLGILTGRILLFRDSLGQLMNFLRSTPFIVLIPLAILWFGVGEVAKIFIVAWGVTFPVWLNTQAGVSEVEPEYVWAARSLGVKGWRIYSEVLLPRALPFIVAGTRVAIATATFALAAAEMAGAFEGIAYRVFYSHMMFQTEKMMAGIVTIGCMGFLLDRLFVYGVRFVLPWWREKKRD